MLACHILYLCVVWAINKVAAVNEPGRIFNQLRMAFPPAAAIVPPGIALANYLVASSKNHLKHDTMYALNVLTNDPGHQNGLIDFAGFFNKKELLTFLDEFRYATSRGISHHCVQRVSKGKLQSTSVKINGKKIAVISYTWLASRNWWKIKCRQSSEGG